MNARAWQVVVLLVLALPPLVFLSLGVGSSEWGLAALWGWLTGEELPAVARVVFFDLRLTRVILALVVGASLAQSGVVFQALLRNPLAEPYILGLSGGAALGALLAGKLLPAASFLGLFACAFLGALLCAGLVAALAAQTTRPSSTFLLLAGAMVNTLCGALLVLVLALSREPGSQAVFFWLMGDLGRANPSVVGLLALVSLPLWIVVGLFSFRLNLHALGSTWARVLGLDVGRERWLLLVLSSLTSALAVSASGLIGFVGLLVPHLASGLVGADLRRVLPVAMLLGAAILLVADTLARVVFAPIELPVGIFTALLGAPFFLYGLRRAS